MDVQEEFDTVVLVKDVSNDASLRFGEGGTSVEGVAADETAGCFRPVDVKVPVEVDACAEGAVVSVAVLAP